MGKLSVIAVAAILSSMAMEVEAAQLFPPYGPKYTDSKNYTVQFSFTDSGYSVFPWTFSVPSFDVTLGDFVAFSLDLSGTATSVLHFSPPDASPTGTTYGSSSVGIRGPANAGSSGGVSGSGLATRIDANTYQIKDSYAGGGNTVLGSWVLPEITTTPYLTYEVTLNQTVPALCCRTYVGDSRSYVGIASATYYYNVVTAVPEPASLILLSGGLISAAWWRRQTDA